MELTYTGSGVVFYKNIEYQCDLYLNRNQGGILIKINVNNPFASFLELPVDIKQLSGELNTGYKFSLIKCSRMNTTGLVSCGISTFDYIAQYMIEGIGEKDLQSIKFYKIRFGLSNIIEWGNISGYKIGENHELIKNDNTEELLYNNDDISIKYFVNKSMLPIVFDNLLKERIILVQGGNIEISFKKEELLERFEDILKKIIRLIELSTLKKVVLNQMTGWSKEYYDIYEIEGQNRIDKAINIISSNINQDAELGTTKETYKKWKWITLRELIDNNSFNNYFTKYNQLEPIIELYLEIIESKELSHRKVFLNVVQALETYHSRFITNDLKKFKERIDKVILKDRPKEWADDDRKFIMANSKNFITLESRIADLLIANFNIHFDTGDIGYSEFPNVIANTRNYYIHYDETLKDKGVVLTTEQLSIYNRTLIFMLEYYLLLELGFTDVSKIRDKLRERWGRISDSLSILKKSEEIAKAELEEMILETPKEEVAEIGLEETISEVPKEEMVKAM